MLPQKVLYQVSCPLNPEFYSFKCSRRNPAHPIQSLKDMNLLLLQGAWVHSPAATLAVSKPPVITLVPGTMRSSCLCRYCTHVHIRQDRRTNRFKYTLENLFFIVLGTVNLTFAPEPC